MANGYGVNLVTELDNGNMALAAYRVPAKVFAEIGALLTAHGCELAAEWTVPAENAEALREASGLLVGRFEEDDADDS